MQGSLRENANESQEVGAPLVGAPELQGSFWETAHESGFEVGTNEVAVRAFGNRAPKQVTDDQC